MPTLEAQIPILQSYLITETYVYPVDSRAVWIHNKSAGIAFFARANDPITPEI
ncbi:hypothetical protein K3495_g6998 [Podosphaera aphanis]|nr:hypothetical protein K3495_g6998 [Podosphaera aphanis]